ncbi:MAG: hypothetical protein RLZZ524_1639, partial [Pseudomonadota bacterium]
SRIDGLSDALLGLNGATGLVGADFRALVESIDPNNEATRELLAQLLALAPAFAEVSRAAEQAATSVLDEIRRLRGSSETDGQSRAELQARFAIAQAQARAGDADALARLPEITRAIEQVAASTAVSALDIARERAYLRASLEQTLQSIGVSIPAFAEGGMHGGGLRLVGERGPEIEATGPARYWSAEQTAGMMGGSAERLERIEEALRDLMGPLASVAVSSRTSAEALDDSARGRRPLLTRTDA